MSTPDHLRPLGTRSLPADALACRYCGRAVPRADSARIESLTSEGYRPSTPEEREAMERRAREYRAEWERYAARAARPGDPGVRPPAPSFEFGACVSCSEARDRAAALVAAHPVAAARVGSVLAERLESALFRLDMLGQTLTVADTERLSGAGSIALAEWLGMGGLPRWADRLHPVHRGGDPRTCAPEPWAHVPADARAAALSAYRGWEAARLAERRNALDKPRPIACPDGRACMLCGVASVESLSRDAYRAWEPFKASTSALGGRGPDRLRGHVCRTCAEVYAEVRSVGPTLLELSLFAHLDPDGTRGSRYLAAEGLSGLTAWAVSDLPPNPRPWAHLTGGDLLTSRLLGESTAAALSPEARALADSIAAHLSPDAAAELRAVIGGVRR
ncbi:hypothetical protein F6B41_25515 [Microbacterium lushaniae]|nr:hypothetical protein F6B41_33825 [Microbacterium lushaniae]KAA9149513.1 hypothetical protein F6B41_25515 [Microbacterium lushaniae]